MTGNTLGLVTTEMVFVPLAILVVIYGGRYTRLLLILCMVIAGIAGAIVSRAV